MFSNETNEIVIDPMDLETCNIAKAVELFERLSEQPRLARRMRSSCYFNFDECGVKNLAADPRSQAYFAGLFDEAPFAGYFVHGDPPTFHLRDVSLALASSAGPLTDKLCARVHHELYEAAATHCDVLGDDADALEEVFIVNLHWDILRSTRALQARAMRALCPTLILALAASTNFRKRALMEAERIWGHTANSYASHEEFVQAFTRASKEA